MCYDILETRCLQFVDLAALCRMAAFGAGAGGACGAGCGYLQANFHLVAASREIFGCRQKLCRESGSHNRQRRWHAEMALGVYTDYKYCVVATNTYVDPADGQTKTAQTKSNQMKVRLFAGYLTSIVNLWFRNGYGFVTTLVASPVFLLLTLFLLVVSPLTYLMLSLGMY
jgi:hypothetical protein